MEDYSHESFVIHANQINEKPKMSNIPMSGILNVWSLEQKSSKEGRWITSKLDSSMSKLVLLHCLKCEYKEMIVDKNLFESTDRNGDGCGQPRPSKLC